MSDEASIPNRDVDDAEANEYWDHVGLFDTPVWKDPPFIVGAVMAVVVGASSAYNVGNRGLLSLLFSFALFGLIPAFVRLRIRKARLKKARPATTEPEWLPDPVRRGQLRQWDGQRWTDKARAGTRAKARSWVLAAGMVVGAAIIGLSALAGEYSNRTEVQQVDGKNPNLANMVTLSYSDLVAALVAYGKIPIDPNDPWANLLDVKAGFDKVDTNYTLLKGSLGSVVTQSDLGPGSPPLALLQTVVDKMGPWVQTRKEYYSAIESCGPITSTRQPTDCDVAAFDTWEKPMVDSGPPVGEAFKAVGDYMNAPSN